MKLRIIFFGSPDFAVSSLEAVIQNGFDVIAVVTTPYKWGGRGNKTLLESEVKKSALQHHIPILQPEKLSAPSFLDILNEFNPDLQIVVAFKMLPTKVWSLPRLGTINLHGSLLPKYRGAAPINWAIIRGEKTTGLTTFQLKHEIDTGDILMQIEVQLEENDNFGTVYQKMKVIGAQLLVDTIYSLEKNDFNPISQDNSQASSAPKIFHETCIIDFNKTTKEVHDFIRGLSPSPVAWTIIQGTKYKIYASQIQLEMHNIPCGTCIQDKKSLKITCTDGFIQVLEIQEDARKKMDIQSFVNGSQLDGKMTESC